MTPEIMQAIQAATDKLAANMTPNYEIAFLFILLCTVNASVVGFLVWQYNRLAAIANGTNDRLLALHEAHSKTLTEVVSANTMATVENTRLMGDVRKGLDQMTTLILSRNN